MAVDHSLSRSPALPLSRSVTGAGNAGHVIMFWVLTVMALAVFAPCVLVPIWIETQEVKAYERAVAAAVADLQAESDKRWAQIDALLGDPLVNERIVRRELNYQLAGEQFVPASTEDLAALRLWLPEPGPNPLEAEPQMPAWLASASRWLPAWPYQDLFATSPNRSLLLMMAGGLLAAAFLLYGRPEGPQQVHSADLAREPGR
jgi:hypothetical protein